MQDVGAIVVQVGLAFFGLLSVYLAQGNSERGRWLSPLVGLMGQPFWLVFAWSSGAWGLFVVSVAFTLVYLRGLWIRWTAHQLEVLAGYVVTIGAAGLVWWINALRANY